MSALDEVLQTGIDDYWAEQNPQFLTQAAAELARLRAIKAAAREVVEGHKLTNDDQRIPDNFKAAFLIEMGKMRALAAALEAK